MSKLSSKDFFWISPIVVMIIGVFSMPIGYYNIVRVVVFASALYFCFNLYKLNNDFSSNREIWFFGVIAFLYNPIFPVYLYVKFLWIIINIITAYIFYNYRNLK